MLNWSVSRQARLTRERGRLWEPPTGMIPPVVFVIVGYGAIFVMSIVLHEVAHGYVAFRCGDPTAKMLGRLTLNPIKHIDPFMTILMPAMCVFFGFPMFGGAKPVPVNPYHFKRLVRDGRLVSVAGVIVNIVIAWVLAMILHLLLWLNLVTVDSPHTVVLGMGIITNVMLFVFNMLPIPPLDGSRFLRSFLPWSLRNVFDRMDRFGLMIVLFVVVFLGRPLRFMLFHCIDFIWRNLLILDTKLFWHVIDGFFSAISRS